MSDDFEIVIPWKLVSLVISGIIFVLVFLFYFCKSLTCGEKQENQDLEIPAPARFIPRPETSFPADNVPRYSTYDNPSTGVHS